MSRGVTSNSSASSAWPALLLAEWQETYVTLHRWMQILGKTRLGRAPRRNPWWHTALRGGFLGKSSPSHFWWGSFDLACTRFSGRPAPVHPGGVPNCPDYVTREAYSHECKSVGWWPGNVSALEEPAFYADAALLAFCDSTYAVVADLGKWDRAALERMRRA